MKKNFTEKEALEFLYKRIKNNNFLKIGIGDDSALLKNNIVISVDSYVEDVHFKLSYFQENGKENYQKLGKKLVCGAISDIAGCGGELRAVFVSMVLPSFFTLKNFKELYQGIEKKVNEMGGIIGGGDITSGKELTLSITVVGEVKKFIGRDGAKIGDKIYITGYPGLSETGRTAIEIKKEKEFPQSINRFYNPVPPFNVVKKYSKVMNSAIDVSDGLSLDLYRLLEKSKKGALLFKEKIPLHPEVIKLCKIKNIDPFDFTISSGEDYHLIFTSSKEIKDKNIFHIGEITQKDFLLQREGEYIKIKPLGYIHKINK